MMDSMPFEGVASSTQPWTKGVLGDVQLYGDRLTEAREENKMNKETRKRDNRTGWPCETLSASAQEPPFLLQLCSTARAYRHFLSFGPRSLVLNSA
jgi:hypothetical protein